MQTIRCSWIHCAKMWLAVLGSSLFLSNTAQANVALPTIFSDHMVLQRNMTLPVWGWADAGEEVTVSISGQTHSTTADENGKWMVKLEPLQVGAPLTMTVQGKNRIQVSDILVGEVWICSGQSNMQWSVNATWNSDLTIASADFPKIRITTVNTPGVQKPLEDYQGRWDEITPETVADFSAVGYFFGKELHQRLDVPIGLIDNAWGGSSCEAWVRRDHFADNELYKPLMERWAETEAKPENAEPYAKFEADLFDTWQAEWIAAKKSGTDVRDLPNPPAWPRGPMVNQHRPGNLYNGRIKPIMPFAVKGVIWYQGESNAGRAYQYRELFPLMIQNWRADWGQGNFSFYWVQLADFMDEQPDPVQSSWAELREAQTMTMDKLPHTGEAVIIDIGEASDIHPRNKEEVGRRLARWAMAKDYSLDVAHQSPRYREMSVEGNKAILKFDHIGTGLRTVDAKAAQGFAIAGEDQNFVWATAEVKGDTIEVSAEGVTAPVAVRYAWADNPVCNIYSQQGLPLTPFRTDDWAGVTADAR